MSNLQKKILISKISFYHLIKVANITSQNYFYMSTSESQNILLKVDFRKSKYIIESKLSEVRIYYQKLTSEIQNILPEIKIYYLKSISESQNINSIFNIFNFI